MSEITKACPDCLGAGTVNGPIPQEERVADGPAWAVQKCGPCSGTGRVPDVEATLRAQLDEANFERSTLRAGCDSLTNQLVAARAEVARLTETLSRNSERAKKDEEAAWQWYEHKFAALHAWAIHHDHKAVFAIMANGFEMGGNGLSYTEERAANALADVNRLTANAVVLRDKVAEAAAIGREALRRLEERDAEVATLTARLAESEKTATRYRRLFEGRCLDCNNLDPAHAPDCVQVAWEATR